jgi:hypothetical protein
MTEKDVAVQVFDECTLLFERYRSFSQVMLSVANDQRSEDLERLHSLLDALNEAVTSRLDRLCEMHFGGLPKTHMPNGV